MEQPVSSVLGQIRGNARTFVRARDLEASKNPSGNSDQGPGPSREDLIPWNHLAARRILRWHLFRRKFPLIKFGVLPRRKIPSRSDATAIPWNHRGWPLFRQDWLRVVVIFPAEIPPPA
jgi:hypothetical protein